MESHSPALPLVRYLHLDAEDVAELSFQRRQIGIRDDRCITGARTTAGRIAWPHLFAARALFRLTYRQPLGHNLSRECLRVFRCGNRAGMAHADIASHQRLAHELRKIQ